MGRRIQLRSSMTVDQAAEILAAYGSDEDPVFTGRGETSARDLAVENGLRRASSMSVQYFNRSRMVTGSLATMVYDRMELRLVRDPRRKASR